MCNNCKKHKGTEIWVGESGVFGYAHGMGQSWCKCCVLKKQLKHAKKMVKNLAKLEKELKLSKCF